MMAYYKPAMKQFLKENVITLLFELIASDEISFVNKQEVALTLSKMFEISKIACSDAIDCCGMVKTSLNYSKRRLYSIYLGNRY